MTSADPEEALRPGPVRRTGKVAAQDRHLAFLEVERGDADGWGQETVRSRGERGGYRPENELQKENNLCLKITIYFEFIIYIFNYMPCFVLN